MGNTQNKSNILRYTFAPKYQIKTDRFNKTFINDSISGLYMGIMDNVTNGLGYNKIRKSRKTNITSEELYSHLRQMDERTNAFKERINEGFTMSLIALWDEEKNYLNEMYKRLGEIRDNMYERNINNKFEILEYKQQLERKDAEIRRLREGKKKKGLVSLFSEIFN